MQKRKLSRLPPPRRGTYHWAADMCAPISLLPLTLQFLAFLVQLVAQLLQEEWLGFYSHILLSLTYGLVMRIFCQEMEVGCSKCWEDRESVIHILKVHAYL